MGYSLLILGLVTAPCGLLAQTIWAQDYGNFVHHEPTSVVHPKNAKELSNIVKAADTQHTALAIRGNAHTTYGQAEVPASGGFVVDMLGMNTIDIAADGATAWVGGGVLLKDLVTAALARNLRLPVLTDYLNITVGGVLSNGGIGGWSVREGLLIHNVLQLEVVSGRGDINLCSPTLRESLFSLVLGGLGQYGTITRAQIRLVPLESNDITVYELYFPTLESLTIAQQSVLQTLGSKPYLYLEGFILRLPTSTLYWIEVVQVASKPPPSIAGAIPFGPGGSTATNQTYAAFADRLGYITKPPLGSNTTNPWFFIFVPCSRIQGYIARNLEAGRLFSDPMNIGAPILYYPVPLSALRGRPTTNLVLPNMQSNETCFYIVGTLGSTNASRFQTVVGISQENLQYAHAQWGAVTYPVGAPDLDPHKWEQLHYGVRRYALLRGSKKLHDPKSVLNRGQRVFSFS